MNLETMPKQEAIERKRMFFAGATCIFCLMKQAGEVAEQYGDKAGEEIMNSLSAQLTGFAIAVKMNQA